MDRLVLTYLDHLDEDGQAVYATLGLLPRDWCWMVAGWLESTYVVAACFPAGVLG